MLPGKEINRAACRAKVVSLSSQDCDADFNGELDLKEFRKVLRPLAHLLLYEYY